MTRPTGCQLMGNVDARRGHGIGDGYSEELGVRVCVHGGGGYHESAAPNHNA